MSGTSTDPKLAAPSPLMDADKMKALMDGADERHIQNLVLAFNDGIKIIPSETQKGHDFAMLVSPEAYEAFKKRVPSISETEDG